MTNERRLTMMYKIEQRRVAIGQWMLDNRMDSIRKIAREFNISKSQCHRDIHNLKHQDDDMYVQCMNALRKRRK